MSSKNIIDLRKGRSKPAARDTAPLPLRAPETPRRREPLRARRRRARLIIWGLVVILLGLIAVAVSVFSYLPRLTINSVVVSGASAVSPADIQSLVEGDLSYSGHHFLSPDNIILFDQDKVAQDIAAQFPRIASAHVSRPSLFSQEIDVSVVERQPEALWCDDTNTCYLMDDTGFIFAPAQQASISASSTSATSTPSSSGTLTPYVFEGGLGTSSPSIGQSFESAHMPGILVLLQLLGQAGFNPQGIDVQDGQDFYIPLSQGFYLKASFGEDADTLVQNLQLILSSDALQGQEQNLEYVDLRFGDKVYYKLNGQDETSASSSSAAD